MFSISDQVLTAEQQPRFQPVSCQRDHVQCTILRTYRHTKGQLMNSHTTPSRLMTEVLRILFVHLLKVVHIRQKHLVAISIILALQQNLSSP